MKKLLFFLLPLILLGGCTTNYYLITSSEPTELYAAPAQTEILTIIPAGNNYLAKGSSRRSILQWGSFSGYTKSTKKGVSRKKLNAYQYASLVFLDGYGYVDKDYAAALKNQSAPSPATTTRSYGTSTSSSSGSGGTVHVRGYTRKDGTYVRPHTRSAPRRH